MHSVSIQRVLVNGNSVFLLLLFLYLGQHINTYIEIITHLNSSKCCVTEVTCKRFRYVPGLEHRVIISVSWVFHVSTRLMSASYIFTHVLNFKSLNLSTCWGIGVAKNWQLSLQGLTFRTLGERITMHSRTFSFHIKWLLINF